MNFTALIDWLDDRINPIVVKELRQAVKSRMVVSILMLFLCVQLFLLGVFLSLREAQGDMVDWSAGSDAFSIQQVILLWTIAVLVPAYAAIRMGAERADHNVDLMFISTLRPGSIIWGKYFSTFLLGMLVFSTCAPFMTFTYLLRGIDIPTIAAVLAIDLLTMLFGIMFALFLASLPGVRALKFVYSFAGFIGLVMLTSFLTWRTTELIQAGGQFLEQVVEYWPVSVSVVAGVFSLIGLLYCYSVAIISPPSSNRMLPVRLYLIGLCAVTLAGALVSARTVSASAAAVPIGYFLFIITPLLFVQMWVSVCEREQWGPRVARGIPRRAWLRLPAFLLYTGSAGGLIFSAGLLAVCLAVCAASLELLPAGPGPAQDVGWRILRAHLVMGLYALCYAVSAVLVRRYVLSNQIRTGYTWVIASLLVGMGSTVPFLFAFFFFSNQMRYGNELNWWFLPNPFVGYFEILYENRRGGGPFAEYELISLWFLVTWATIVALLSLRWVGGQVRSFRPPAAARGAARRVVPEAHPNGEASADAVLVEPPARLRADP